MSHIPEYRNKILNVGDVATFKKNHTVSEISQMGIVVKKGMPCSDGEVTYIVLCCDNSIRTFFDFETDEVIVEFEKH
tara:strand:- start:189 stop:419 length:231 start_codon:yes stop_codon:yes gene_type:complete